MLIQIKQENDGQVLLYFTYNEETIEKIRSIKGRRWIPKQKCWALPYTEETVNELFRLFSVGELAVEPNLKLFHERNANNKSIQLEAVLGSMKSELKLKGFSFKTIKAYLGHIKRLIRFHNKDISEFVEIDIRNYILYLIDEQKSSSSYVNQAVSSIKFLFYNVLKRKDVVFDLPRPKKENRLPDVLSQEEVYMILNSVKNSKHKAILFIVYSSGLRVGEVVRLKLPDIDSQRRLIHIRQGKGKKDRYTMLSDSALKVLREYFQKYRPQQWLFPGGVENRHLTERSVQRVFEGL